MTPVTPHVPRIGPEVAGNRYRVREIAYAAGTRQPPHHHDVDSITLILRGGLAETAGRQEQVAGPLSVVVKPAGVVHADRVGPRGARTIQVVLEDDVLDDRRRLGPWRWIHAGPGVRALLALQRALRVRVPVADAIEERVLELLGEVAADDVPAGREPPPWLRRAREALHDRLATGVRVRDLAAEAGVHPVSLTRAFRRHYGASVTEIRRRERLRRAAAAIQGTRRDLTRIAHATGYADHAHMCREVREATGRTPSEIRALARGAGFGPFKRPGDRPA